MAEKKEKQYVSDNAQLMAEWDWEKNTELGLDPQVLTTGSGRKAWWICSEGHGWQASIDTRSKGHGCPYCSGRYAIQGINDLATINPILAKEWNHDKNGGLKPEDITVNSNKTMWWICSEGHEWQARVASRNAGNGCPYCSGRYAVKGINDLVTVNPNLSQEWDFDKNVGLTPSDVLPNSNIKVWWKCSNGHKWKAAIKHRHNGANCPYCAGVYPIKGENDLLTVNPTLANEWHYQKNHNITPSDVLPNSNKKVWWKCNKGHEWQAIINDRNRGNGCPICNSERHTSFPEFAIMYYLKESGINAVHTYKELGYELDIYIPSKKAAIEYDGYYWHKDKSDNDLIKNRRCKEDGIKLYRIREGLSPLNDTSIDYIIRKDQTDLSTVLKAVLSEIIGISIIVDISKDAIAIDSLREYTEKRNSFLLQNPEVSKEWNYELNGELRPENFAAHSSKKVWWKCSKGHEWQATISSRHSGNGCPYCTGRRVIKGETDLQTVNPALALEWDYENNDSLVPSEVAPGSHKVVWWNCSKGHKWQESIKNRNAGNGCPYCSGRRILKGYNDLQSVNPKLSKEWNFVRNGALGPENFTAHSNKKVWWKCICGHEWQATINHRSNGQGCPQCAKEKRKKSK